MVIFTIGKLDRRINFLHIQLRERGLEHEGNLLLSRLTIIPHATRFP